MKRALIAFLLLGFGCSSPPTDPELVVRAYFRALGRDPMRTLPLTTDAFHRRHEMMLAGTEADPGSVDRQQAAWLAVQRDSEFAARALALDVQAVRVEGTGDSLLVVAWVAPRAADAPAFEQRFELRRGSGGLRIEAVTQSGVEAPAYAYAYVAYPSRVTRERLAVDARLGKK